VTNAREEGAAKGALTGAQPGMAAVPPAAPSATMSVAKREEESHLAQQDDDVDPALLLAEVELDSTTPTLASTLERALVFLDEERAKVVPGHADELADSTWYLDTGASNNMTGNRSVFTDLDEAIT
jgi:hypothetical protein